MTPPALDEAASELVDALKAWRLTEAQRRGIRAYRILTDRALAAIVVTMPPDEAALLGVAGVGPKTAAAYGKQILAILERP